MTQFTKAFGSFLFSLIFTSISFAQILDPVKWNFSMEKAENGAYDLVFSAEIEEHWHLYTQDTPEDGPIPTTFNFDENKEAEFIGPVKEGESITAFEDVLQMELSYFSDHAEFRQRVKNTTDAVLKVSGWLEYMTCDDTKCLPPTQVDFSFDVPVAEVQIAEKSETQEIPEPVVDSESIKPESGILEPVKWNFNLEPTENGTYLVKMSAVMEEKWHIYGLELEGEEGPLPTEISVEKNDGVELVGDLKVNGELLNEYDGNFMMNLNFYEGEVEFVQEVKVTKVGANVSGNVYFMTCDNERCLAPEQIDFELVAENVPVAEPQEEESKLEESPSYWGTFIKGFFGGFLALLTPCVFPMIPLTVSFFTKQSKTRAKGISNAILYGVSIIGLYVLLGYGVTAIFGADALNALSTNVWFNLFFFVLLVVFAISFFGAFEITLPSSWVNKADTASDKGGIIGIFFMAFTLAMVSFSCTGPIIGTLLVDAAVNGGVMGPLIGMFGFSFALAMPFALFAAFPGWLNSLPSSGGWLNSVKVVLGFLELAFAFKFLSNADLVVQAGLLKRELFIAIWIAIFALLTLYLLGIFSLPHDSKSDRISVPRLMMAVLTLMFTIYLIPGIWGAPLKLISGFPPPMFYSESPQGLGGTSIAVLPGGHGDDVVGEPEHCPHNLNCFHDYDEGLAYAREVGKPVMLDFTGWACVNCRKMEEQVWSDPTVLKLLRDDIVLISLYVDEKIELPKDEQKEVEIGGKTKKLRTVGNKWSYLQAIKYNTNSQPYYVIIDHDENTMNGSAAYDPDVAKFKNWLEDGISKFHGQAAK